MKIVVNTTPIRPYPTDYPPFGSLAVIQSLRLAGYDPYFYDIDALRPSFDQVLEFYRQHQPDVVAISAVVSTAYGYTKELCQALREILPNAVFILGGNLAASAEILHRLCGIDFCVVGEGERVVVNLMRYLEDHGRDHDYDALKSIRGITYLERDGHMRFTGYEEAIPANEMLDPDFSILERYSDMSRFINDPSERYDFAIDPRSHEAHRIGKKMSTIITAKGCVARCTFCHRWDKGYRAFSVEAIVRRIKYLMDSYNVGFFQFGDENFGSDRRQADELLEALKPLDILYQVGGVRCWSVDPDLLRRMRESGCTAVYYGMETGSPTILSVMEKKTSLEQNVNAAKWTHEAGLYTCYQLVLGMPGETSETIHETTEFLKRATEFLPDPPASRLSVNYIQALPGTPVYEYARTKGFIGKELTKEEEYLLLISDIDAGDDTKFINFTEYDYLTVQSWRRQINVECMANWWRYDTKRYPGLFRVTASLLAKMLGRSWVDEQAEDRRFGGQDIEVKDYTRGGYFNLTRSAYVKLLAVYPKSIRTLYVWFGLLRQNYRRWPRKRFFSMLGDCVMHHIIRGGMPKPNESLRQVMKRNVSVPITITEQSMQPLRDGR